MRLFSEYSNEVLKDQDNACIYLKEALSDFETDGNVHCFLGALKDVTAAQGGIGELAKRTNLNRQNLYKLLSAKRQPKVETLGTILNGLGFQLSVVPKDINIFDQMKSIFKTNVFGSPEEIKSMIEEGRR